MAFRTIGKTLPRIEGEGKVTGQTKYAADLRVGPPNGRTPFDFSGEAPVRPYY